MGDDCNPWLDRPPSERERALDALAEVLRGIPGIRLVSRQALTEDGVSDPQLPAVLIVEPSTRYVPASVGPVATSAVRMRLLLDVQGYARRGCSGMELSSAREALVHAVLEALHTNPGLRVQLPGEPEPQMHAVIQGGLPSFNVTYIQTQAPYVRATIELELVVEQRFDARQRTGARSVEVSIIRPPEP